MFLHIIVVLHVARSHSPRHPNVFLSSSSVVLPTGVGYLYACFLLRTPIPICHCRLRTDNLTTSQLGRSVIIKYEQSWLKTGR